jgi:HD-GYP domain-containing protein (c-di-GMP phosphodiesterase class II)
MTETTVPRASGRDGADAALLGRVPLLRDLRPSQLVALAAAADVRRIERGRPLCTAGSPSPGLIAIRAGRVLRGGLELGPGDWFDELEAFDLRMATETAVALDDVECLVLPTRAVHEAVRADPDLGIALLRETTRHLVPPGEEDAEQLMRYASDLRESFREGERRQAALRQSIMGTVRALVALAESKDPSSAGHAARAARTARALARALGDDDERVGHAALGGLLHDVGMIAVDAAALTRERALSPHEQAQIQAHPELGARIMENIEFLRPVIPYVLFHHERYDGRGYPRGLTGREIPREGRLLAAVEVCESLRPSFMQHGVDGRGRLIGELRNQAGRQLDREMVVALCRVLEAEERAPG